jgi:hypothetical protein
MTEEPWNLTNCQIHLLESGDLSSVSRFFLKQSYYLPLVFVSRDDIVLIVNGEVAGSVHYKEESCPGESL